jgi:hypothetical protein
MNLTFKSSKREQRQGEPVAAKSRRMGRKLFEPTVGSFEMFEPQGLRLWRRLWRLWATLFLLLGCSCIQAQSTNAPVSPQTNAVAQTETNTTPRVETKAVNPRDYAAFKIIADRNIFDPNRYPRSGGRVVARPQPAKVAEVFSLVGTLSYEKGQFAFFDGTSSDYKKQLKLAGTIAGYKITGIKADRVEWEADGKKTEVLVGTQFRKMEDGTWQVVADGGSYGDSGRSNSSSGEVSSGAGSDVLAKLMKKREQELQNENR